MLLTLPDPHSFNLILHYLYWGDGDVVTDALVSGKVDWMGLFNNIEVSLSQMTFLPYQARLDLQTSVASTTVS